MASPGHSATPGINPWSPFVNLNLFPFVAAFALLAGCNGNVPSSPHQLKEQLIRLGQSTETTMHSAKQSAETAKSSAEGAAVTATSTADGVKESLTSFGENVTSASDTAASTLTKVGEAAQAGVQHVSNRLTSLGELVLEATSDKPAPTAAPAQN
ncbi:hypothetical protein WDL1P1_00791 (plasmid) [Variovorax sp. WDL1]|nr:hypothetical protein WDL1P1_00791 [Variovorax sp. WDL1]